MNDKKSRILINAFVVILNNAHKKIINNMTISKDSSRQKKAHEINNETKNRLRYDLK